MLEEILSRDVVTEAVSILVTRFLPLKPSDLEKWQEDPEEFLNADDKESELWEFDTRVSDIEPLACWALSS